jgi:hypothetical protein
MATAIAVVTKGIKNNDCKKAKIRLFKILDNDLATIKESNKETGTEIKTYKKELPIEAVKLGSWTTNSKFLKDQRKLFVIALPLNPSRKTIKIA